HYNVFNHLTKVMPVLKLGKIPFSTGLDVTGASRGGRPRAYASAEHPIALGAAFAMLIPLALYLAKQLGKRRWWVCLGLMVFGLFATVSRTGFLMLIVVFAVVFWYRRI